MTASEEFLAILVVVLLLFLKKKYYRFIERKFPEVDWDEQEE